MHAKSRPHCANESKSTEDCNVAIGGITVRKLSAFEELERTHPVCKHLERVIDYPDPSGAPDCATTQIERQLVAQAYRCYD